MNLGKWITRFRTKWEKRDVKSWLWPTPHGVIVLNELQIVGCKRGHGLGSRFMTDLCKCADKHLFNIEVLPSLCYGASSLPRLIRFYKRFGFRTISKKRGHTMIRFHKEN